MRKIPVFILVFLFCLSAFAETLISVSGSATVQVSADYAIVRLGVNSREKTVLKAQSKTNSAIANIRAALIKSGLAETDISTERISISAQYDYSSLSRSNDVSGYNASQVLLVKVAALDSIGSVIDEAFSAGANTLSGIEFFANDTKDARDDAMRLAVENAKEKASVLAEALGLEIKAVQSLSESHSYSTGSLSNNFDYSMAKAEDLEDYSPTLVRADKINVNASVDIVFIADLPQ